MKSAISVKKSIFCFSLERSFVTRYVILDSKSSETMNTISWENSQSSKAIVIENAAKINPPPRIFVSIFVFSFSFSADVFSSFTKLAPMHEMIGIINVAQKIDSYGNVFAKYPDRPATENRARLRAILPRTCTIARSDCISCSGRGVLFVVKWGDYFGGHCVGGDVLDYEAEC